MPSHTTQATPHTPRHTRRLKAEWEQHRAILLSFPHMQSDWASDIASARACFLDIIESIISYESVLVCVDVRDTQGLEVLQQRFAPHLQANAVHITPFSTLELSSKITLAFIPTNDTWARDFGAITCELETQTPESSVAESSILDSACSSRHLLLDFVFNGWGLKYAANFDNLITRTLYKLGALQGELESSPFVLEGGSIDSDGIGSILTTTACLLESNRNPTYTQAELESMLKQTLGIKRVLWIKNGYLQGDDTDSHIDMLARFIAPDTIAYVRCDDSDDEHYASLCAMESELQALKQLNGEPYKLIPLPFVPAIYNENDERLPASYANFLFVESALLVPIYNKPSDNLALEILQNALDICATQHPHLQKRKVIGVNARTLIEWHGSLHCVTMQLY